MTITTTGKLMICSAALASLALPSVAWAQQLTFDLPSQAANRSIPEFARQAGVQIVAPGKTLRGVTTRQIRGQYDVRAALSLLLQGTGLRIVADDGKSLTLGIVGRGAGTGDASDENASARLAAAQSTPDPGTAAAVPAESVAPQDDAGSAQDIVVTGTNIRGEKPIAPTVKVTREDIARSGYNQTSDLLLALPSNFGGGQNQGVLATGTAGFNQNYSNGSSVNLRGLGAGATLALLGGRRLPQDGNLGAADISVIPIAAIDHIDVVTEGASALYGSDAVAGVVNFILRTDFNGLQVAGTEGRTTEGGPSHNYYAMGGRTWASGHLLANVEYTHQGAIYSDQRDITSTAGRNSLLPRSTKWSFLADGEQDLSDNVSLRLTGLYSRRTSLQYTQVRPGAVLYRRDIKSKMYTINPSILFKSLPFGWSGSIDGSYSRDTVNYISTPASTEPTLYDNKVRYVEATASGPLVTLPGGQVKLAVGGGYRWEGYRQAATTSSGVVAPVSRKISYVFGEANVPLVEPSATRLGLNSLTLDAAVRYEHYSGFGGTTNPKVAVRYVPVRDLAILGTWGTSFRAPTFYQLYSPARIYLFDEADIGGTGTGTALYTFGGNTALTPEKAKSWTAGINFTPQFAHGLSVNATYFHIKYTDRIAFPISSAGQALSNPVFAQFLVPNPTAAQQAAAIDGRQFFDLTAAGAYNTADVVAIINGAYINAVAQTVEGVDGEVKYRFDLENASVDLFANATLQKLVQKTSLNSPNVKLSGTLFNVPRARFRAGATFSSGGFTATGIANYISSETDTGINPSAKIGSWTTVDANIGYRFQQQGPILSGLELSVAAINLLNEAPPYAAGAGVFSRGLNFDSTNTSAIGRVLNFTVRKTF